MEEHDYAFYEEPCRFDHLEETKEVADALTIPVAGGEQEFSDWRFRWMIDHRGVDIVQPDLHYYGGFIRSHAGGPDGGTRRACSARRTCRARGWATSTCCTSPRAARTRERITSSREMPTFPSTATPRP